MAPEEQKEAAKEKEKDLDTDEEARRRSALFAGVTDSPRRLRLEGFEFSSPCPNIPGVDGWSPVIKVFSLEGPGEPAMKLWATPRDQICTYPSLPGNLAFSHGDGKMGGSTTTYIPVGRNGCVLEGDIQGMH